MKINLPLSGFAPFKVMLSVFFLTVLFISRDAMAWVSLMVPLFVGKAHALGAWISMWRAGRLTTMYVVFITLFVIIFTYLGLFVWTLTTLGLFTALLFMFHFLYDEFDLQEEKRMIHLIIAPISVFSILVLYILSQGGILQVSIFVYFAIFFTSLILEMIFNIEINWFFINMKILQMFLLICVFLGFKWTTFLGIILVWHYLFWLIYPVYKVHKYNLPERDGFILMLVVLLATNIFYVSSDAYLHEATREYLFRYFNIITIVHVLGTSPFGYFFGLSKSKYQI